jgi:hypothetical protein
MKRSVVLALGSIGGDAARSALAQMKDDPSLSAGLRRNVEAALSNVEATSAAAADPKPAAPNLGAPRR